MKFASLQLVCVVVILLSATPLSNAKKNKKTKDRQVLIAHDGVKDVVLDPDSQHQSLDARKRHLRPPPPRIPENELDRTIFMGTVAFRDGTRCGETLFSALLRAEHPERVVLGVVDQVFKKDLRCLDVYCKLAKAEWTNSTDDCPYRSQIRVDLQDAGKSRGPSFARHYRQLLIEEEEFCMQVDSHTVFTKDWDTNMIQDWNATENEMAVITTYPHHIWDGFFDADNGTNTPPTGLPHNCDVQVGGFGLVRLSQSKIINDMFRPQLGNLWGGGLVFSKCHAERRVKVDSKTQWQFDGEEYMRAALLWVSGYDMYTPTGKGHAIYHNYTAVPALYHELKVDRAKRDKEEEHGTNRIRLHMGMEFEGLIDTRDLKEFSGSRVRHMDQFLNFSGVSFIPGEEWKHHHTCYQLHWVPYEHPEEIEALLPGWKQDPGPETASTVELPVSPPFTISHIVETLGQLDVQGCQSLEIGSLIQTGLATMVAMVCIFILARRFFACATKGRARRSQGRIRSP